MEKKIAYITPVVTVTLIELEEGIAAGSSVVPANNEVRNQWVNGEDDSRTIDW